MNVPDSKYRLITRSDMDGLVCAVLLKEIGLLGEIVFQHPKDMQDGKGRGHRARHHHQPAVCARLRPVLRPPCQ